MCGIVGYIGTCQAAPVLLDGLSKLEYRGYDSAGIAVYDGNKIQMQKAMGRLKVLEEMTQNGATLPGTVGIGHTRWATMGPSTPFSAALSKNSATSASSSAFTLPPRGLRVKNANVFAPNLRACRPMAA